MRKDTSSYSFTYHTKYRSIITGIVILALFLLHPFFIGNGYGQTVITPPAEPESFWLWNFLGRLHPLAVHFPVSLILFAAILEIFTLKNFNSPLRAGINVLTIAGVISAIISAILGWILSRHDDYGDTLLNIHQWTGITTAILGAVLLILLAVIRKNRTLKTVRAYRGILFFMAFGVAVAGHFGASLTHGDNYLSAALPWSENYEGQTFDIAQFASLNNDTSALNVEEEAALHMQVKTIFAHNCYKCHGANKVKGDLRLDRKDMVFKGGESGPVIVPGKPMESELFRRITLPGSHEEAMPSKGKRLSEPEINLIGLWIRKGAPWPPGSDEGHTFQVAKLEPRNPPLPQAVNFQLNPVDLWVNEYFKKDTVSWPAAVNDRIYLRRIYLDIIGLLPGPEELETFLSDPRPDKRSLWVRQLLNRNNDYAAHWLSFWNDALRNDYTGTGYITGGRSNITDWLYKSLKSNKPYDLFVKELISPNKESKGFIEGIKWRGVINASQKTEMQAAQNVAQVFLGLNLKCASCHNSFVNNWQLEDAYAFANIFADSSLEINRCDKPTGKFTEARILWKELGTIDNNAPRSEKQKQLSENLVKPENGRLYRTIVNRVWAQLMGRGMVEPVDIMDNKPWSQDLLDWMAFNFVENKFDIKELIYLIVTSNTYQLPSVGYADANKIIDKDFKFRGMLRKRMSAEQFADAVSYIIEPVFPDSLVKYKPVDKTVREPVKQLFARASLVVNNPFLTALGRPNRETVSTGRESQANLLQALELTKGEKFNEALEKGARRWTNQYGDGEKIIKEVYKKALGREPQPAELDVAERALGNAPDTAAVKDLLWAVTLLPEFQIIY